MTISRALGISAADMATLVDNLAYGNTSEDPGSASRVVTVTSLRDDGLNGGGNDNINSTLAVASTVTVTPVNDEPTLTATGLNPGFTENGAAVDLFSTVATSAIEAGQNLNTLILTVSNVAGTGATENLTIDGTIVELTNGNSEVTATNGMTASVTLSGGVATVTISKAGGVSAAIMNSIVDGLAYDNTSENPGAATRMVTLTSLSDLGGTANGGDTAALNIASSVAVTPVNDAPVIDLVAGGGIDNTATTATFSEGSGPPSPAVIVVPTIDFSDVDSGNLTGATVTLTDFVGGQDVITVSGNTSGSIGGVTYSVSGNVITFSGTASFAAYETAIQAVQYNNSSENPAPGARNFEIQVTDGTDASTIATATVNVVGQNDAPVVTIPADAAVPTAFSNTDTAISGISIADVDAGSGTVTTQLTVTNGTVAVSLAGGAIISGGANGTATLTLSGTAAAINATLANNVSFHSTDGFTGQANLTVLTNDGGNSGLGGALTDTEVVHIGVVPQVWFIDNTGFAINGPGGTGTAADPFRSVADFNNSAGPGVNDYIMVRTGTGTYTGEGLDLQNGQQVWGAGETLSFTNPVNGNVVNIPNAGTRPTISVTGGDQGIDLAANNTIRNINISTAAGTTGLDDGSNDVGTLVVRNMDISGAGQAVDIDQGGTLDVQLGTVSSSGGTFGVQLAGTTSSGVGLLSGSFSATGGAISGSASVGFQVGNGAGGASTGGTAVISYGGTINTGAGVHVINIQDHSTGAVTFSGNLTHTGGSGSSIVLDDNSSNFTFSGSALNFNSGSSNAINITDQTGGTTVTFSGILNIDTTVATGVNIGGANAATFNFTGGNMTIDATGGGGGFIATGGGTVNVTGTGNHIATTTGTALNISNTTIGGSGLTFHDISVGTAAGGAVKGIILNNAGSGGLTVTGTGTTNGSGGTIQDAAAGSTMTRGIEIINTSNVSLNNMQLTNANRVQGAMSDGTFGGNENTDENGAIHLQNASNISLNNVDINGAVQHGINGNLVTNLDINNSTIQNTGNAVWESGIYIFNLRGTSAAGTDNTISNTTISHTGQFNLFVQNNSATNAAGSPANYAAVNRAAMDLLTLSNSTFQDSGVSLFGDNVTVISNNGGNMRTVVTNSTFIGTVGGAFGTSDNIQVDASGTGHSDFDISGSSFTGGGQTAINASAAGTGFATFDIHDNTNINTLTGPAINIAINGDSTMRGYVRDNPLIYTTVANSASSGVNVVVDQTGLAVVDIDNNAFVANPGNATHLFGNAVIRGGARNGVGGEADLTIRNNTVTGAKFEGLELFSGNNSPGESSTVRVNFVNNDINGGAGFDDYLLTQYGTNVFAIQGYGGAANNQGAVQAFVAATDPGSTVNAGGGLVINYTNAIAPTPLLAAAGGVQASSPTPGDTDLSQDELESVIDAAIALWEDAGASPAQLAALAAITFSVDDLAGDAIGEHTAGHIVIDTNAAGHGWFIDSTPWDNFEFAHAANAAGTVLSADPTSAAAGHLDLLSAVIHEMGHELGLTHSAEAGDVMADMLVVGERRLPDPADVAQNTAGQAQASAQQFAIASGGLIGGMAVADNFVFAVIETISSTPAPLTQVAYDNFAAGGSFDFSALTSQVDYPLHVGGLIGGHDAVHLAQLQAGLLV